MKEKDNRFYDDGSGIVWLSYTKDNETHEKPDTQGTITEHSEENS